MAGYCTMDDCYPEESGCNLEGCDILTKCKNYRPGDGEATTGQPNAAEDEFYVRTPWTGNTLGLKDLTFLAASTPLTIIGIAGVASAGKTTFLATLYCLLRNGFSIGDYRWAGSLTLTGWENIAWYLSWKQHNEIQFPPHTTTNAGRVPGLLHLALRNPSGERKDLIFTDAPGEWFDDWTTNKHHVNAQGAVWIHRQADAFLLFADCQMLAGQEVGKARRQTKQVADRLRDGLGTRPLGLVWSKSDVTIEADVKQQISTYLQNTSVAHYREFTTSIRNLEGQPYQQHILNAIQWILDVLASRVNELPPPARLAPEDLFLSKRQS